VCFVLFIVYVTALLPLGVIKDDNDDADDDYYYYY